MNSLQARDLSLSLPSDPLKPLRALTYSSRNLELQPPTLGITDPQPSVHSNSIVISITPIMSPEEIREQREAIAYIKDVKNMVLGKSQSSTPPPCFSPH